MWSLGRRETVERHAGLVLSSRCEPSFQRVSWASVACGWRLRPFPAFSGLLWPPSIPIFASFSLVGMIMPWPRSSPVPGSSLHTEEEASAASSSPSLSSGSVPRTSPVTDIGTGASRGALRPARSSAPLCSANRVPPCSLHWPSGLPTVLPDTAWSGNRSGIMLNSSPGRRASRGCLHRRSFWRPHRPSHLCLPPRFSAPVPVTGGHVSF